MQRETPGDTSAFEVAEVSHDTVREELVDLLNQTRPEDVSGDRFDWLYRHNPDGEAAVWTVRARSSGTLAGFSAALPRRMLVAGEERICWNCGDLSVGTEFRRRGLAVALRSATRDGVDSGRVDFLYGQPNDQAAGAHVKVGHLPVGKMLRYARPLKLTPYLQKVLRSERAAQVVGWMIDPFARLVMPGNRHRKSHEVVFVDEPTFDDRYDRLFEDAASSTSVLGIRDSRYLHWRYAQNPLYRTQALEARAGERLVGYMLFTVVAKVAQIVDLFPPGEEAVLRDLLATAAEHGRQSGLQSLSVTVLEGKPLLNSLVELGFRKRPHSSQLFAYSAPGRPWCDTISQSKSWFVTEGDHDV